MAMAVKEVILEKLKKSQCGLFGTRDSIKEAQDYALMLIKAAAPEEKEFCALTAINVYHNTVIDQVIKMVESVTEVDNE